MTLGSGGSIAAARDYYPFGGLIREYANGVTDRFKFTEKERDVETNYDYFGARYYDSELGRWMSVDPLASEFPEWSPYNYCYNDPLGFTDDDGMEGDPNYVGSYMLPGVTIIGNLFRDYDVELRRLAVEFGNRETFVGGCMFLGATAGGVGGFGISAMGGGGTVAASPMLTTVGAVGGALSGFVVGVKLADYLRLYNKDKEHVKNARPSTEEKHEKGQSRKKTDRGGEKADEDRRPSRIRPNGWKGSWPPK